MAARLQVSPAVVYRLVEMRAISAVRVINSIRIAEDDVEEFLRKNGSRCASSLRQLTFADSRTHSGLGGAGGPRRR